jgi:hypothetical protein
MKLDSIENFFVHELKDLLSAETPSDVFSDPSSHPHSWGGLIAFEI